MSTGTYVTRRSGTANLSARIIVPPDLRDAIGKAEIWKSLGTADKREAQERSAPVFAKVLAEFDAARRRRPATEADIQQAAYEHYVAALEHDRIARTEVPQQLAFERAEKQRVRSEIANGETPHLGHVIDVAMASDPVCFERRQRELRRKLLADMLATGETISGTGAADAVIEAQGLDIAKGSPAYVDLCQRLQRADLAV